MFLNQIREHTRALHEALERDADVMGHVKTLPSYKNLIAAYYGYFGPLESRLTSEAQPRSAFFSGDRCRTQFLHDDLTALGYTEAQVAGLPQCAKIPMVASSTSAVGCRYVLEGSALGGRIISRIVAENLGLTPETGTRFFQGWGEETGRRWRDFGIALESFAESASPAERNEMLTAAASTFTTFHDWLRDSQEKQRGG